MDSICEDLKRDIISLLPINYLTQVNKNFASLYDNNYYKKYLNINYPDMIFQDNANFLETCKKSFEEGDIYKWGGYSTQELSTVERAYSLNNRGIKASPLSGFGHLILRFNGDLWVYDGSKNSILIDTDVTDIDGYSYIKHNKWYYVDDKYDGILVTAKCILLAVADEDFININSVNKDLLGASTSHTLYVYSKIFHFEKPNLKKTFNENILRFNFNGNLHIDLLLDNGELIYLDTHLEESIDRKFNIDNIFDGLINTNNIYYIYDRGVILEKFTNKYGNYISNTKGGGYILTDKYILEKGSNNNYKIMSLKNNVKNISGRQCGGFYDIR